MSETWTKVTQEQADALYDGLVGDILTILDATMGPEHPYTDVMSSTALAPQVKTRHEATKDLIKRAIQTRFTQILHF